MGYFYMFSGGRQFKVTSNDLIVINRITADVGKKIILEKVHCIVLYTIIAVTVIAVTVSFCVVCSYSYIYVCI